MNRQPFNHRKPLAIALLYFAAITLLAVLVTSCGSRPKGVVKETIYIDSLEQLTPRNIYEEMNTPVYRIYWSNGQRSISHRITHHPGDSSTATTYIY
jgi:hypothetical protein